MYQPFPIPAAGDKNSPNYEMYLGSSGFIENAFLSHVSTSSGWFSNPAIRAIPPIAFMFSLSLSKTLRNHSLALSVYPCPIAISCQQII